jgi:hypothetical protein
VLSTLWQGSAGSLISSLAQRRAAGRSTRGGSYAAQSARPPQANARVRLACGPLAKSAPAGVASRMSSLLPALRAMPSNGKRRVRRPKPYCGKDTPPQPGDEVVGEYTRERLIRMDVTPESDGSAGS